MSTSDKYKQNMVDKAFQQLEDCLVFDAGYTRETAEKVTNDSKLTDRMYEIVDDIWSELPV